jgi:hypothetical protein
MIATTLFSLSARLTEHLKRVFRLDEDIVLLQPVTNSLQTSPTNKVHLFPVNLERETAGGIGFNRRAVSDRHFKRTSPSWLLNVYVMIAAVFSEKQYGEGLQFLDGVAAFLQTNNSFQLSQFDAHIGIETVNISFQELTNLWSICGGVYYPSFLCKLRNLTVDSDEIRQIGALTKRIES